MAGRYTTGRTFGQDWVTIENVDSLTREMRQMRDAYRTLDKKLARKYVRKAVTEATKNFKSDLRRSTPKSTGVMRKGITSSFKMKATGGGFFKLRIGFDRYKAPHALLIEEGTKIRRTKSGANRGRVAPQHFLRNLTDSQAKAIANRIAERLRVYLESLLKKSLPNTK